MPQSRRLKLAQTSILRRGWPVASSLIAVAPVAYAQQSPTAGGLEEIIVTAQKREESLQNVPLSVQAIDTERLEQLQVKEFRDYVKYMPSVAYTSLGPGFSLPYFRGVASGENNNHSGPQPSVGMYLDEQPITTIQGALDIHMYDIARVEALAGPQGTLYGASSQAGTIRIITNKPDADGFAAGYGFQASTVEHGGTGYVGEGFVNLPVAESAAVRLVGWVKHDPGYIDNIAADRVYPGTGACVSNRKDLPEGCVAGSMRAEDDFNDVDTYGARAALRVDLNDNWTITPQAIYQKTEANGSFAQDAGLKDYEVAHFHRDYSEDKFFQGALTIEGRIGNFDLVYAGAYLDRDDVVDADYSDYMYWYDVYYNGGFTGYFGDSEGNPLPDPSQFINGSDAYKRQSHELRLSSPQDWRVRFVTGLFYQDQEHEIFQNYQIPGLGGYVDGGEFFSLVDPNWPDTMWLTNQLRKDRDSAIFGELSFDVTDKLTATAGARFFETHNSIRGFFGFMTENWSTNYGVAKCAEVEQPATPYKGSPCENLHDSIDDSGDVLKGNLTYRLTTDKLVYFTYSEGFRPGGINRNNTVAPYKPDTLTNYELGWKTTWGNTLRFNGAIFHEDWEDIQYSFLPPSGSGLTVIRNAGSAEIDGLEAELTWAATEGLTLSGGFSILDAKLSEDYVPGRFDEPEPDLTVEAFEGDRLPVTPEFKANLTARYEFPIGGYDSFVQASGVYNGDTYSDLTRADREVTGKNPDYTLVNLAGGIAFGDLAVELFINNVTDELATSSTFVGCATSVCFPQPYYVPTQPRMIGLRVSQEF